MKVSKNLVRTAAFNPTKTTLQLSTSDLNTLIDNKEITLPLYQRDVSWTMKKSIELLNYQLNGKAPVSAISMNKMSQQDGHEHHVQQISLIERELVQNKDLKHGHYSIVDGQQRLTTNYKAYKNHDDFKSIVLDLVNGDFRSIDGDIKKTQIPVGILLNKDYDILKKYIGANRALQDFDVLNLLNSIRNKLLGYNYTVNLANDLTEDEQIEWFEVLNNAGSRVTRIQMEFSKLKMNGIDIYNEYTRQYLFKLQESGFDIFDVKSTEVSIPIANLNPAYEIIKNQTHKLNFAPIASDTKEKQLCSLTPNELKKCFDITLNSLDTALKFVYDNSLKFPSRLDYITYLTGYFVFNPNTISDETEIKIIDWYKNANFSNKSNGERRKIFDDLIKIK